MDNANPSKIEYDFLNLIMCLYNVFETLGCNTLKVTKLVKISS